MPPPTSATSNGVAPRIGTPQNDTSWAGWAISSFTNKLTSTTGEIEAKIIGNPNLGLTSTSLSRSSSVPPISTSSVGNARLTTTAKPSARLALERQALKTSSTPTSIASSTDQLFSDAAQDATNDDDFGDAWGDMGDMNEAETFFDAPDDAASASASTPSLISTPASPQKKQQKPAAAYDDSEPDFAGWLSAQAQSKSKAPLPKGLSKLSASGTSTFGRTVTTGAVGSGLGTKKAAAVPKPRTTPIVAAVSKPKVVDTKPKESANDDWDAWD